MGAAEMTDFETNPIGTMERLRRCEEALRASKVALEECANLLRVGCPSIANNVIPSHIRFIDAALKPEQETA
jgi:hypothetical protein